ncbi:hypothetical protein RBTH_01141 [Bacillus thuringiensis serovar israelensis ATCC 35646]|nr:hypothetical protein RBTH_01141 [Bacillus thuringiensis serovar israelensis ATCC 35646]
MIRSDNKDFAHRRGLSISIAGTLQAGLCILTPPYIVCYPAIPKGMVIGYARILPARQDGYICIPLLSMLSIVA